MAAQHSEKNRDKTRIEQEGEAKPRLPHETDTSSDSQRHPGGGAPEVGRQAHEDLQRGLVDTDRSPVTDKVYNEKLKPAAPRPQPRKRP